MPKEEDKDRDPRHFFGKNVPKIPRDVLTANYKYLGTGPKAKFIQQDFDDQPVKKRIKILDHLKIVEPMDYEKAHIKLNVTSWSEVTRLRSAQKEPFTVQWIESVVQAGDVFYDIGANVGAYSLIAAATTDCKAKIFSFEPASANYDKLCQNILTNEMEAAITPIPLALTTTNNTLPFSLMGTDAGRGTHNLDPEAFDRKSHKVYSGEAGEEVKIRQMNHLVVKLDTLIKDFGLPLPNHLKLDVEGHELSVLQGATELLKSDSVKTLLLEVREESSMQEAKDELIVLLESFGFKIVAKKAVINKRGKREDYSYAIFGKEPVPGIPAES